MYCPKCKDEFREGWTHCNKCNEDLVESLDEKGEVINNNSDLRARYLGFINWKIEKWFKVGGVVLIIVSVLYEIIDAIRKFIPHIDQLTLNFDRQLALISIFLLIYALMKDIMWGLFYIGMGHIIEILKEGQSNEKN
jgi:hypothetical protein